MHRFFAFLLAVLLSTGCANLPATTVGDFIQYHQVRTAKPYDDVLAELKVAIAEHNFRITSHSRVGKVIRQRGTADFPDYDTIQFCNLSHAKTLIELSVDAVRHMPCSVVLYNTGKETTIKTRLLPVHTDNPELNRFSESINRMLRDIVDFAADI
ncbi:MAG: DUF302 domain-containing protein [Methylococcus sp.]|jgi:uncharacterized protein (DUF302 family)|nr:MAG: DUF302 domain-containing protein [Methylococcus sp.]